MHHHSELYQSNARDHSQLVQFLSITWQQTLASSFPTTPFQVVVHATYFGRLHKRQLTLHETPFATHRDRFLFRQTS